MKGVTRLPETPCPICGKLLDAAGTIDGSPGAPAPGDWTICSGCLQWLVYLDDMQLRAVTNAEWLALTDDERAQLTQQRALVERAWSKHP